MDTLGVYVHLPFCRVRCTYCPFSISTDLSREEAYFDALLREIVLDRASGEIDTLYFGGGTPTRSSLANLEKVIAALAAKFTFAPELELTVEANPEDITSETVAGLAAMGVTRVSLGVQSFADEELSRIGRRHGADHARNALALLARQKLRLNADLIIGLPEQTTTSLDRTIDELLASGVGHISLYMLDLEEGTKLEEQVRTQKVVIPPDDEVAAWYLRVVERLEAEGFRQYEISNFARPGEESRHNMRYWNRLPYCGYGVGAHRFDGMLRSANAPELDEYIELIATRGDATVFRETLGDEEREREEIFLALRQRSGISYADLARLRGEEGQRWAEQGLSEGWLRSSENGVGFTPQGFVLSNEHISALF